MYSLITKLICWRTIVNLRDFYFINLWNFLLGGLGWSSRTVSRDGFIKFVIACQTYYLSIAVVHALPFHWHAANIHDVIDFIQQISAAREFQGI